MSILPKLMDKINTMTTKIYKPIYKNDYKIGP